MLWFKYSFLGLLLTFQSVSAERFDSNACLKDTFSTVIRNEGRFFGLIKNELTVSKNLCDIEINFKNILDTKWKIDICREPIHIKLTSKGTQSIQKRISWCEASSPTEFCLHWKELKETLQDYGLIFASGERESLKTPHGQTYCTFLLVNRYINDGYVFSKYDEPLSIYGSFESAKEKLRLSKLKSSTSLVAPESKLDVKTDIKEGAVGIKVDAPLLKNEEPAMEDSF